MKKIIILILFLNIILGCVSNSNSQNTENSATLNFNRPQLSDELQGKASGNPIIVFYGVPGWNSCMNPSISYDHNLEVKTTMKPLNDVNMPKWGVPFYFKAFYYHQNKADAYKEFYIITSTRSAIDSISELKCFDLVFEDLKGEKMCKPENIIQNLKKWLIPNRVTIIDQQKILKAAKQLPMTLSGCYKGQNLDIILSLKENLKNNISN